ncbi:GNAT family N-acetyltransferase [Actinomycetota bacterium]
MKRKKGKIKDLEIRSAVESDSELLLDFIKQLAKYEKKSDQVVATVSDIKKALFENKYAEAVIAYYKDEPVGFAIFFHNFSTFIGKPGIYIEDLYVDEKSRGRGMGSRMLSFIADLAIKRGCEILEFSVLKWNKPSIRFYRNLGAEVKNEWSNYRFHGRALKRLALSDGNLPGEPTNLNV